MTAAAAIVRVTIRQLLGLKRLIGFGVLALFPAVVFYLTSSQVPEFDRLDQFLGMTLGTVFIIVIPIVTLIVAASALGDERRDSTLSFLVLRPMSRPLIAVSKLGAAILSAFALTGGGALVMGVAYGARTSDWGFVLPIVVGTAVATAVYASIFVPLGYLAERSTLLGLAYVFIWENGIVSAITGLSSTSPWRTGFTAFHALVPEAAVRDLDTFEIGGIDGSLGSALTAAVVFLVLSTLFITWTLKRRDLA